MLQRHAHAAHELVIVVPHLLRRLLSEQSGHRSIGRLARPGGLHRHPVDAVGHDLRFGKPVAERLKGGERAAELLAFGHVENCRIQRTAKQARRLRSQRHAPGAPHLFGGNVMAGQIVGKAGQERHRIRIKRVALRGCNHILARGERAHARFADDHDRSARFQEPHRRADPAFLDQAERARQVRIDHRAHQRRGRRLDRHRQTRKPLDHQRRRDRPQFFHRHDVEKAVLDQLAIECIAGRGKRGVVQVGSLVGAREAVDEIENLRLIFGKR